MNRKHGLSHTPEYKTWKFMHQRCNDPKHRAFPAYGGRGIKVCERWSEYTAFLADMGPRPEGMQVERINNDGDYEPSNCRWATHAEQARNRRSSHFITAFGESLTIAEWSERSGLRSGTIFRRLELGWSAEQTVSRALRASARAGDRGA